MSNFLTKILEEGIDVTEDADGQGVRMRFKQKFVKGFHPGIFEKYLDNIKRRMAKPGCEVTEYTFNNDYIVCWRYPYGADEDVPPTSGEVVISKS